MDPNLTLQNQLVYRVIIASVTQGLGPVLIPTKDA